MYRADVTSARLEGKHWFPFWGGAKAPKEFRDDMDNWLLNRRLFLISAGMVLIFGALSGVFAYVQMVQGDRYLVLSQENRIRRVWIGAPRGKILDRNGVLLVGNRPSFDVVFEYEGLKERKSAMDFLSSNLKLTPEAIDTILKNHRGVAYLPIPIKKDVDMATLTQVEESALQVPWVSVEVNPVRDYVLKEFASSILGYVGPISKVEYEALKDRGYHWLDTVGKSGVEFACEAYLRGEPGGMQIEVDHRGYRKEVLSVKKPLPGRDVYLTLEKKIQDALEEVLDGKVGCGLVMNPKTGEILGALSKPGFDLNVFVKPDSKGQVWELFRDPARPLVNRAFLGLYAPGSVFKLVVAAAGLDSGILKKGDWVRCQGVYQVGGSFFRCWREGGHGKVSLARAIKHSCNVFFYHLAQRLGPDRIAEYAKRFGLGHATGLDAGNEREGFVPTPLWKKQRWKEEWYGGDTANFAIGQGFITVTPLQMATFISAIANGGKLMSPFLVKKVILPEGRTLIETGPKVTGTLSLSERVLSQIRKGMWAVVNEEGGTGSQARLDSVEVCGKTGTVQVTKGDEVKKQGWFVAYAPAGDPQVVLVLLVEGVYSGGRDVAPLARKVLERCFA